MLDMHVKKKEINQENITRHISCHFSQQTKAQVTLSTIGASMSPENTAALESQVVVWRKLTSAGHMSSPLVHVEK